MPAATASPTATYRRRITVDPGPDAVHAEMEDWCHHFAVDIRHRAGVVVAATATGVRIPWVTCAAGASGIASMVGVELARAITLRTWASDRTSQCVHAVDLAAVALRHALDGGPTRFVIDVTPNAGQHRQLDMRRDGETVLTWRLTDGVISGPDPFTGLGLDVESFYPGLAERGVTGDAWEAAVIARRASRIAGSRSLDLDELEGAGDSHPADGSCFTFRSAEALPAAVRVRGTLRATEAE